MDTQLYAAVLGNRLKLERQQQNISLSFLAKYAHVNKGYLSEVENGKRTPSDSVLYAILDFLDFDLNIQQTYYEQAEALLEQVIDCYIKLEDPAHIKIETDLFRSTLGYGLACLAKAFQKVPNHHFHLDEELVTLSEAYTDYQATFYHLILGKHFCIEQDLSKTLHHLNLARQLGSHFELAKAISFHIEANLVQGAKAFLLASQAKLYFQSHHQYMKRCLSLTHLQAKALLEMNLIPEALELLETLEQTEMADMIQIDFAFAYYFLHQEKKSAHYLQKVNIEDDRVPFLSSLLTRQYHPSHHQFDLALKAYFLEGNNQLIIQAIQQHPEQKLEIRLLMSLVLPEYERQHQFQQAYDLLKQTLV